MAFTLGDRPTLDIETSASPRWQRFAGGRRLTRVGYRGRMIRFVVGTTGAAIVGAALLFGDERSATEAGTRLGTLASALTHDATATAEAATRSIMASWEALASWARIDTQPRRPFSERHLPGPPTSTTYPQPTETPDIARVANLTATSNVVAGAQTPSVSGTESIAPNASVFGARATATSALTGSLNVGTSGATMSQPSPTAGVRQPAGTAIPVITSTTVVAIATATVPRSAPVSATATIPRLAPTAVKPATSVAYQVVAGDTLWGIATRYGSSVDAIVSANRLVDADSIVPGARLVIPR